MIFWEIVALVVANATRCFYRWITFLMMARSIGAPTLVARIRGRCFATLKLTPVAYNYSAVIVITQNRGTAASFTVPRSSPDANWR